MAEFVKKTYYFKLVGKKTWFFRVDSFEFSLEDQLITLTMLGYNVQETLSKGMLEKKLNELMTEYSLKYVEVESDELEKLKLFYEA